MIAALPAGALAGVAGRGVLAQPAAADPVSFYLGQVLALATLQAFAVRRLQPLLAMPAAGDAAWVGGTSAEAGVIGAVAGVIGGMEPPPELAGSVNELRLASTAYQAAAVATQQAAAGDAAAIGPATASLAEGAAHILLWLDALTAETGNDWGDGLRTLTEAELAAPAPAPAEAPAAAPAEEAIDEPPAETPSANTNADNRRARRKARRGDG